MFKHTYSKGIFGTVWMPMYRPDDGGGSGGGATPPPAAPPVAPAPAPAPGAGATPPPAAAPAAPPAPAATTTSYTVQTEKGPVTVQIDADMQVAIRDMVSRKLDEQKQSLQSQADKQRQDAIDAALKDQGKHAELAETRKNKIDELEPKLTAAQTRVQALTDHVNSDIDQAIQNWPAVLKELDPGKEHVEDRMQWYAKVKKHVDATGGPGGGNTMFGTPPRPGAHGSGGGNPVESYLQKKYAPAAPEAAAR